MIQWCLLLVVGLVGGLGFGWHLLTVTLLPPKPAMHSGYFGNGLTKPFAHRGSRLVFPQNTMFAFLGSVGMDANVVLEMDLRLTKDGEVVLTHDEHLGGITGHGEFKVEELTLQQLEELDYGYTWSSEEGSFPYRGIGITIPRFEQVLQQFPHSLLNIELKIPGPLGGWFNGLNPQSLALAHKTCKLIRKYGAADRILLASFSDPTWFKFRQSCPEVSTSAGPLGLLHLALSTLVSLPVTNVRYNAVQIHWKMAKWQNLIMHAQSNQLAVHVWTVNDIQEMKRLQQDAKVDGIMSDRLDWLLNVLNHNNSIHKIHFDGIPTGKICQLNPWFVQPGCATLGRV
ncbi:hypothetical protein BASA81_007350 [Batrachochytrium salamandrivorans]|nr:hypothetical protein BASA81_007350 [Batrachochytrium salamandrivorans]